MSNDTTYDRILNAASDVFCKKGFDSTTIRDICTAADANVAAVNYHFGDKQNLYYKVLQKWMHEFMNMSEATVGITQDSTPEERLRAYIRSELKLIRTYDDPDGIRLSRMRMLLREVTSDDHDHAVFECHMEEEHKLLFPVVEEITGPLDGGRLFEQACMAASSMLTHYFVKTIHDPSMGITSEEDLEFMTDFLTTFVIGGLNAIKEKHNA